jgi:hypothetical protein
MFLWSSIKKLALPIKKDGEKRRWGDGETKFFTKSLKIGIHQELREQSVTCKEGEKVQSDRFSILIPLPFLRLSLADATRAKNLGSCSNL